MNSLRQGCGARAGAINFIASSGKNKSIFYVVSITIMNLFIECSLKVIRKSFW